MNEITSYKRNPTVDCWIKHILEGRYSLEEKLLFTIFGKTKRVRIICTIIDKREIMSPKSGENESFIEYDENNNMRLEFDLDDGTGLIRATIWRANLAMYKGYNKGDIVDVVGLIRRWKDFKSISPEIIRKVEVPNYILLRNAEIINKIKKGEIYDIPEIEENIDDIEDISNEINVDKIFENKVGTNRLVDLKEKIYLIIEKYSEKGDRVSFERLKQDVEISDNELRSYINDLISESRIYEAEKNNYEAF